MPHLGHSHVLESRSSKHSLQNVWLQPASVIGSRKRSLHSEQSIDLTSFLRLAFWCGVYPDSSTSRKMCAPLYCRSTCPPEACVIIYRMTVYHRTGGEWEARMEVRSANASERDKRLLSHPPSPEKCERSLRTCKKA